MYKIFSFLVLFIIIPNILIAMQNPSAVYAEKMGYGFDIHECEGGQCGYVVFPDGSECLAWSFFGGFCGTEWSYCEKNGYITQSGTPNGVPARCVTEDGTIIGKVDELLSIPNFMYDFDYEGDEKTYYQDADADEYGDPNVTIESIAEEPPSGYVANQTDCDDKDAEVHPKATEVCDGIDNNCNGEIDEMCCTDADGDGYCEEDDCNDNDPSIHEGCDGGGGGCFIKSVTRNR